MTNEEIVQALQHLIGTYYVDGVKAQITAITGRTLVAAPNDAVTKDFNPQRIRIRLDEDGAITGFAFN
jgi:hypothetical protein